jgi:hypothetical protein
VIEQNFEFELISPAAMLGHYVGREITVLHQGPEEEIREKAVVKSTNQGSVLEFPDRIEANPKGRFLFPEVPASLRPRPMLVNDLVSEKMVFPQI